MTGQAAAPVAFNLPRLYSGVELSLENALLSSDRLNHPPSLDDGLDMQCERDLRFFGCQLIQSASVLLRLPQVAAATGQVLYHRFYYAKSFVRCSFEHTAMACIYLASKIEEDPRRIRDVLNVFHHMKQLQVQGDSEDRDKKRITPLALDHRYISLKNEVIKAERRVLKELGFCVHVKHPHKLIYVYLKALDALDNCNFLQKAWNYMNDSLRTDVFMRYPPETIACACVFLAARFYRIGLPMKRPWWQLFDAKDADIVDVAGILLKMYRRGPVDWLTAEQRVNELRELYFRGQAMGKQVSTKSAVSPSGTGDDTAEEGEEEKKITNGHSTRQVDEKCAQAETAQAIVKQQPQVVSEEPAAKSASGSTSAASSKAPCRPRHKRRRKKKHKNDEWSNRNRSRGASSEEHSALYYRKREDEVREVLDSKYRPKRQKHDSTVFDSSNHHYQGYRSREERKARVDPYR